jgi:hypothetical protein
MTREEPNLPVERVETAALLGKLVKVARLAPEDLSKPVAHPRADRLSVVPRERLAEARSVTNVAKKRPNSAAPTTRLVLSSAKPLSITRLGAVTS